MIKSAPARGTRILLVAIAAIAFCVVGPPAIAASIAPVPPPGDERGMTPLVVTGPIATAANAGLVTGVLLLQPYGGGDPLPVVGGDVSFYSQADPFWPARRATSDQTGAFSVFGLPAGAYTIAFSATADGELPVRQWYPQERTQEPAEVVSFVAGVPRDLGTIVIAPRQIELDRQAGDTRFETAVSITKSQFDDQSAPEVFIVNGLNFPDALSAGALAGNRGALLMVEPNRIPPAVAIELSRLQPSKITIVGGEGVVSPAVQQQLQAFISSPSLVTRIAGVDRYDTSRQVITAINGFDSEVNVLFIVTGRDFPDALAAVPPAVKSGAAILLVDGKAFSLDSATRQLLTSMTLYAVYIVGGDGAVSAGIENEIANPQQLGLPYNRYAGDDRFETTINVAVNFYPAADYAYIANAFSFADALAAGPVAGQRNSPIYLTRAHCLPESVFGDIIDVLANNIVAVGGRGVVTDDALEGTTCG